MASSLHFTPPRQVSARLAPPVMLCCFPPASSSTPLRPSVNYPSISLILIIRCIRTFSGHLNVLHIFGQTCIVLKSGWSPAARMPRLVRRADPLFLRPASLPPSFLSCSVLSASLPPSSPPYFLCPASLSSFSSSISPSILHLPFPSRRFGSSCKVNSSYVICI